MAQFAFWGRRRCRGAPMRTSNARPGVRADRDSPGEPAAAADGAATSSLEAFA
jgi:hypothetical protein